MTKQAEPVVQDAGLASDEHFTVDGTLLEAWASLKRFQAKDKKDAPPDASPLQDAAA